MDRTMYGKIDPGARNPYRCIREKGLPPGCKFYFFPHITISVSLLTNQNRHTTKRNKISYSSQLNIILPNFNLVLIDQSEIIR